LKSSPLKIEFRRLTNEGEARRFRGMTFPRFLPILRRTGTNTGVVAIGGVQRGSPTEGDELALALGWFNANNGGNAELLSLFVHREHRGRGLARAALAELERVLKELGARTISSVYVTRLDSAEAFEAVLRARQWSPPLRRMLLYRTHRDRLREADWFDLFQNTGPGVEIREWGRLTDAERSQLAQDITARADRAPNDVNPFRFEGTGIDGSAAEPALSLACLLDGRVIGWNLAHRLHPRLVRFSCSFVWPEMQGLLPLLTLLDQAYHRLQQTTYLQVSWAVAPHHEAMVRFNEHTLLQYVDDFDESRGAIKILV
jgi:GNAT superfamily N-acetyltransferase